MLPVIIAVGAVVCVSGAVYTIWKKLNNYAPSAYWSREKALSYVADTNEAGSGYRDLEGKTMSYDYVGFGSFQLAFYDNRLKWQGFGDFGYFVGVVAQVDLQVSKVDEGVYFLSWATPGGGDNVVVNLTSGTVYAHLYAGTASIDEYSDFDQIHGRILCLPSENNHDIFPAGTPTGMMSLLYKLYSNSKKYNLPSINNFQPPLVEAHAAAKKELKGKVFRYHTAAEDTEITLVVDEDSTIVTTKKSGDDVQSSTCSYRTHVTKISNCVYFISWLSDEIAGKHVVVNTTTNQLFDHILPNGKDRKENIYKLIT